MEFVAPTWLDKEFIRDALRGGKDSTDNDAIVVEDMKVDKPIAKGDNYACEIFRAVVDYRKEEDKDSDAGPARTSLIVKSPIVGGMSEMIMKMGTIQKEVKIYNKYIPRLNWMLGSPVTPKSFYSARENVLVLEDLKFQGYVMADRREQLDYVHTVIALKALALFHAASVKLHEEDPVLVEEIGKEVFFAENPELEANKEFARLGFLVMADEAKNDPQLQRYTEKLLDYSEKAWDLLKEMFKPKQGSINVLNHGDFWVNNMLFQKDESNNPIGVKLLDLQLSRYARPTIDLMYFLYGSVQEDVRDNRLDEILKVYVDELNKHLERFGASQRLTESELNTMMAESEFFGLTTSISLYPIVTAEPNTVIMDFSELSEDQFKEVTTNPMATYFKSKRFLKTCVKRFADFEKKGLF